MSSSGSRTPLLRGSSGVLLVGRALALLAVVVLVRPGRPERALRAEGLLLRRVLRHVLRLGPRRVALLRLALAGKNHELALVQLQARNVLLEALRAAVLAAVVHGHADGLRELLRDARLLQLIEGEALSEAHLGVVALRPAVRCPTQ